eukprot:1196379-Prorocentrum_minimum.AAC.1
MYIDTRLIRRGLQAGGDGNIATAEGVTALHVAAQCGKAEAAEALLKHNVDPNARNAVRERGPKGG